MIFGIPDRYMKHLASHLALGTVLLLGGCQQSQEAQVTHLTRADKLVEFPPRQPSDRVNDTPIIVDEAMQARDWQPVAATYPNFSSTAGPTEVTLEARPDLKPWWHAALETPLFVTNIVLMPLAMWQTPPWDQVEATSFYVPPSYTANPPSEPTAHDDLSGGTGIGYTPEAGRAALFPGK
jgi:hypothetical protein